jgi:RepB plasmid partitioning protein/ParB/Sulfiredoxin domain
MPPRRIRMAFRPDVVLLGTDKLVVSEPLDLRERHHQKYKQIESSLAAVGLIEPLVVFPNSRGTYRVLDGKKRLDILLRQHVAQVECLISTDDEAYNYNRRVNYLSTVGENQMILKALEHNSEDVIAKALGVNVSTIRKKRDVLNGICKEAVEILKARRVAPDAFAALRKMKPVRQIEAAELMVASNMYSGRFASALLAGTRDDMRIEVPKPNSRYLSPTQRARLANETDMLLQSVKSVEAVYGTEVLAVSVSCRYVERILRNAKARAYLNTKHAEILAELQSIVDSVRAELEAPQAAGRAG